MTQNLPLNEIFCQVMIYKLIYIYQAMIYKLIYI